MDDGVTLRPPPVCTGRGRRLSTHGAGTACAPCSPVALHALRRLLDGLLRLSYDVRSLFHMAKCQVQKDARDALSMRNTVRSLTPGGWSKVAKVLEVPQTQFVRAAMVVSSISLAHSPLRAVGVTAPPCPGGQVARGGRQHSWMYRVAE